MGKFKWEKQGEEEMTSIPDGLKDKGKLYFKEEIL